MTNQTGTRPFVLEVEFPLMENPKEITQTELNRLLNYLRSISSNDDYEFKLKMPHFMKIKVK